MKIDLCVWISSSWRKTWTIKIGVSTGWSHFLLKFISKKKYIWSQLMSFLCVWYGLKGQCEKGGSCFEKVVQWAAPKTWNFHDQKPWNGDLGINQTLISTAKILKVTSVSTFRFQVFLFQVLMSMIHILYEFIYFFKYFSNASNIMREYFR